jgi:hypothetical protein
MKYKPIDIEKFDEIENVCIYFDNGTSHNGVLYQVIEGLVKKKFAPRKEIIEEWHNLLSIELCKDNKKESSMIQICRDNGLKHRRFANKK